MARQKSYSKTAEQDFDNDGVVEEVTFESWKFDKNGLLLEYWYKQDWDDLPGWDFTSHTVNTVNSGAIVKTVIEADYNADGVVNSTITTDFTFEHGKLVVMEQTEDWNTDGDTDAHYITEYDYNRKGLLEKSVLTEDWNGDDLTDSISAITFGYNGRDLAWEWHDSGNDGVVETVVTYDYNIA